MVESGPVTATAPPQDEQVEVTEEYIRSLDKPSLLSFLERNGITEFPMDVDQVDAPVIANWVISQFG